MSSQRVGQRRRSTVIARPRSSFGVFLVRRFGLGEPVGIQKYLMLISQNSHERIGEIPAEPGCRFRGNRNGHRRLDGQISGAVAGQVEYGRLAREKSRFGNGNNGGKTRAAPSF